tara:strand:+ start:65 stop:322 length:258 start_codon:yes stop_codon:yes gene_type:complete
MSQTWLEELEKILENGQENFLEINPHQEFLLSKQCQIERFHKLNSQQTIIETKAEKLREELLQLSEEMGNGEQELIVHDKQMKAP